MMWSFASNAIGSTGMKKNSGQPSRASSDFSDEEISSDISREEGLECPVCWESFNIVENVPYVLWCGHTLCQNCILGLQCAVLRFLTQEIKIPFIILCPWCHLMSFRLVYKRSLKFPCKNYFLLWMIESLNGDRVRSGCSFGGYNHRLVCFPICSLSLTNHSGTGINSQVSHSELPGQLGSDRDNISSSNVEGHHFSLYKSFDFFIYFTSKFPVAIILLLMLFFAIPGSIFILVLYLLVTVLLAIPSILVLYFAFPTLDKLVREITS
ncbi:uncharacterized protein LOC110824282 [Carica papaya]|uniref:uncharacterized protein LOC110824282 n=1 Tax=Carica papaya TaxID=3649 RepID=UPI000B8C85E7|nr:uncharacterized protein LOC110824282 [Carica papaya]